MTDMYSTLDKAIGDEELTEPDEEVTEPIYVWVVRRKERGSGTKYVTKYESTDPERALDFFASEVRSELMADPNLLTEDVNYRVAKYEFDHPGLGKNDSTVPGVRYGEDSRGNRSSILRYLSGNGKRMCSPWYDRSPVDNPAITHTTHQAQWRLFRSKRAAEPDFRAFSADARRDAALERFDKILGK